MEYKIESKISGWKIILPIVAIVVFILILNSHSSGSQHQSVNYSSDKTLGAHNSPVKALPINSPAPDSKKPTTQTKPSNKSISLATAIFLYAGSEKSQLIKKLANGTDDLQLATTNFALALDRDPQWANKVELALYTYLLNLSAKQRCSK